MNYEKVITNVYNRLKSEGRRVYKKEIKQYIMCGEKQDYSPMWGTDLYINRGSDYCRMIEIVYRERNEF